MASRGRRGRGGGDVCPDESQTRSCAFVGSCPSHLPTPLRCKPSVPVVRCKLCSARFDLTPFIGTFVTYDGEKTTCGACGPKGVYFEDIREALKKVQGF